MKSVQIAILLVLFVFVVLVAGLSSATVFMLPPNKELCQTIPLEISSNIKNITDIWAGNLTSQEMGINITYPGSLSVENESFEVCLSVKQTGEYRGNIFLEEEPIPLTVIVESPEPVQQLLPQQASGGSTPT